MGPEAPAARLAPSCFPRVYRSLVAAGPAGRPVGTGHIRIATTTGLAERLGPDACWEGSVPPLPLIEPQPGTALFWVEGRERAVLASATNDGVRLWFDPDAWAAALTASTLFLADRPYWTYLPFHPHSIPPSLRAMARGWLGRSARATRIRPVEFLIDWLRRAIGAALAEPEDRADVALVLSHDVDTAAGLDGLGRLLEIEEKAGVRSCSYVVSGRFPLDDRFLEDARGRGFEIGHHDHYHDYRTAYLSEERIQARFDEARFFRERHKVSGFRAPGWYRTERLLRVTARHFAYDSSFPSWRTIPAPNGCLTRRPFMLGGIPVIPLTVPPDGELLSRGLDPAGMLAAWRDHAAFIRERCGSSSTIHVLTHPEPAFTRSAACLEAYSSLLQDLTGLPRIRNRLPRDLAAVTREPGAEHDGPGSAPPSS